MVIFRHQSFRIICLLIEYQKFRSQCEIFISIIHVYRSSLHTLFQRRKNFQNGKSLHLQLTYQSVTFLFVKIIVFTYGQILGSTFISLNKFAKLKITIQVLMLNLNIEGVDHQYLFISFYSHQFFNTYKITHFCYSYRRQNHLNIDLLPKTAEIICYKSLNLFQ